MSADVETPLPDGIQSRFVANGNGLKVHVLTAGEDVAERPLVLCLHGFPELAYSWRKVMLPLAEAGAFVVAPDQRGYGKTTGWDGDYDGDLRSFRTLNLIKDTIGLVAALGRTKVHMLIGHDFGSILAHACALLRPDVFRSVVMMSAPANAPRPLPLGEQTAPQPDRIHADLAALERPRKHYQWYYATRQANTDMLKAPAGLHNFLRAYYHMKSADWADNTPFRLNGWMASELAKMPAYYIMDLADTMPEAVAPHMPSPERIATCGWLSDQELAVYAHAFQDTGFQGALNWYRCRTTGISTDDLAAFAGRTIDVPAMFVAGAADWGIEQVPGALDRLCNEDCTDFRGCHLIDGAGHWVQQERPGQVIEHVSGFLNTLTS